MHYETALDDLVDAIAKAAGRPLYDWIDGPGDRHDGLAQRPEADRNNSLYTIDIRIATDIMSDAEIEALHARMTSVADEHGIAVDQTDSGDNYRTYQFNLHARFLQPPPAIGNRQQYS